MVWMVQSVVATGIIKQSRLQFALREDVKFVIMTANKTEIFSLKNPSQCLILVQNDWHEMFEFSKNAILMVLASEYFDEGDYIFERYDNR